MKISLFGKELLSVEASQKTLLSFDDAVRFVLGDTPAGRVNIGNAYSNHIWVYVAINAIARNISRVKYKLFNEKTEKEITSGPVFRLFNDVGIGLDQSKLFEGTQIFKQMRGEAFWQLIEGATGIIEIAFLSPENMKEVVIDDVLNGWMHSMRGITTPLDLQEVIHFRFFNPFNMFRGLNPLRAQIETIKVDALSREFNRNVLQNGSYPGSVLETDKSLDDVTYDRLKTSFEDRHKSPQRAGKVAILEGGLKYKEVKLTAEDTALIEQRKLNKDEIHAAYQVPTAITGDTSAFNRANIEGIRRQFWTGTLIPELNSMEENIQVNLLDVHFKGTIGKFDTKEIPELQKELNEQLEQAEKLTKMGVPFADVNEMLNLGFKTDDKPWLQTFLAPFNLVPAEQLLSVSPPGGNQAGITDSFKSFLTNVKAIEDKSDMVKRKKWEKLIRQIIPNERMYASKLSKWILGLRQEILNNFFSLTRSIDNIRNQKNVLEKITDFEARQPLFNENDQLAELIVISMPFITDSIKIGGSVAFEEVGIERAFDLANQSTINAIEFRQLKLKDISSNLKASVRSTLIEGVAAGSSNNEIANNLRGLLNQYKSRSRVVSRTEINGAANQGKFLGFDEAGIKRHTWLDSQDDSVRDSHAAINGITVNIGEPFPNGLLYPGDKNGPPEEVINDRCTTLAEI